MCVSAIFSLSQRRALFNLQASLGLQVSPRREECQYYAKGTGNPYEERHSSKCGRGRKGIKHCMLPSFFVPSINRPASSRSSSFSSTLDRLQLLTDTFTLPTLRIAIGRQPKTGLLFFYKHSKKACALKYVDHPALTPTLTTC
jgi:hypothetical protein